jgi:hypothetical protein
MPGRRRTSLENIWTKSPRLSRAAVAFSREGLPFAQRKRIET